jgi:hypothetical protein
VLTPEAAALIYSTLQGGRVEVSDGKQTASAPCTATIDGMTVTVTAAFGETEANFDWRERRIFNEAGALIDVLIEDHGRKVAGSEWDLTAELEIAAA